MSTLESNYCGSFGNLDQHGLNLTSAYNGVSLHASGTSAAAKEEHDEEANGKDGEKDEGAKKDGITGEYSVLYVCFSFRLPVLIWLFVERCIRWVAKIFDV
jgi:hypothetical protein